MDREPQHQDAMLPEYLADRDEPCPSCGYNLRGLSGNRCPECALEVCLGVQLSEARTGLMVSAIIGLMLSAAPAAAVVLFVAFVSVVFRVPEGREILIICGWPAFVALTLGTCTVLLARAKGRRWFRRLPASTARGLAVAAWSASFVGGLVYVAIILTLG